MPHHSNAFVIATLGCKVNQCESLWLENQLQQAGWQPAADQPGAELCIVNTCSVTHKSAMQSRQVVRALLRRHQPACMVVTGCYAQTEPEALAAIEGVTYVLGQAEKYRLPEIIRPLHTPASRPVICCNPDIPAVFEPVAHLPLTSQRSRAFLKIQDGCNAGCTYCIVPRARGAVRSMAPERVVQQIAALADAGYREVVLTGIHLGQYGTDVNPTSALQSLLELLIKQPPPLRLRLSSLEPLEVSSSLLQLIAASSVLCDHLHIPLQSGADSILAAMNRPYTQAQVRERILEVAGRLPRAAIGMDVMVGFPGETDSAFRQTCDLLENLPISYLHVFPFSARPHTPAASLPQPVSPVVRKARVQHLQALGVHKKKIFWTNQLGQPHQILIENRRDSVTGWLKGLTDNYIPVLLPGPDSLKNQIVPAVLEDIDVRRGMCRCSGPSKTR